MSPSFWIIVLPPFAWVGSIGLIWVRNALLRYRRRARASYTSTQ